MSTPTAGYDLVFLLIGTFRRVIDDLHRQLAAQGFPDARPVHGFALQAIGPDAVSITELGRRLGVSKQAAAKTVSQLEAIGFIVREPDPADARASRIRRSAQGTAFLTASAAIFDRQQEGWIASIGEERFAQLLADLATIGGTSSLGDFVGWLQAGPATGSDQGVYGNYGSLIGGQCAQTRKSR